MSIKKESISLFIIPIAIFVLFFKPIIGVLLLHAAILTHFYKSSKSNSSKIALASTIVLDLAAVALSLIPFLPKYCDYIEYACIALAVLFTCMLYKNWNSTNSDYEQENMQPKVDKFPSYQKTQENAKKADFKRTARNPNSESIVLK